MPESNDKGDLDLRNISKIESTVLRSLLGLREGREREVENGSGVQFCLDLWLISAPRVMTLNPQSALLIPSSPASFP